MAQQQKASNITAITNSNRLPPSQLWIGSHGELIGKAEQLLHTIVCAHNGCGTCTQCHKVNRREHYNIIWLYPEKKYTLDQLEIIGKTTAFALAPEERFFFVLQKADFLTSACANSLLKSIEEPPPGYHFLLLAEREDLILPTIRSRCVTHIFHTSENPTSDSSLFRFFTQTSYNNPLEFQQTVDKSKINERESFELLDKLLSFWIQQYKTTLINNQQKEHTEAQRVINILKKAMIEPPMPGSGKIFWRDLFLQIKG